MCQRCPQAFNFQIIPYAFQPCLPRTDPRVTINLIAFPPFLAMCLDPYVEYDCTNEEAHVSLHFLYYADPVDF